MSYKSTSFSTPNTSFPPDYDPYSHILELQQKLAKCEDNLSNSNRLSFGAKKSRKSPKKSRKSPKKSRKSPKKLRKSRKSPKK
jgi:hypothetical protein